MRLLVLADSLAFHGPERAEPSNDPRLWPNVAAARLGGTAELAAGFGWTARDAWRALVGDPRVWSVMPTLDAVVLGVGSMDSLPSPLPTYLREGLRVVRPPWLRRRARSAYLAAQPALSRASAALLGGRPFALPAHVTVEHLDRCVLAVRGVRPGLPVVAVLPATHRAAAYGSVHPGRARHAAAIASWAARAAVPTIDLTALTGDLLGSAAGGNADGMHWGWPAHAVVGAAIADAVRAAVAATGRIGDADADAVSGATREGGSDDPGGAAGAGFATAVTAAPDASTVVVEHAPPSTS